MLQGALQLHTVNNAADITLLRDARSHHRCSFVKVLERSLPSAACSNVSKKATIVDTMLQLKMPDATCGLNIYHQLIVNHLLICLSLDV